MKSETHTCELISRLARLDATDSWNGDINPTQHATLSYLAHANRFSRSPSHVTAYLGATRGTTSQTLKSLLQKGYVEKLRSTQDKRVISYDLSPKGRALSETASLLENTIASLSENEMFNLQKALTKVLRTALAKNGNQEFGACRSCIHHRPSAEGAVCSLLATNLSAEEADQICSEQVTT
jgi:DNA-binding MarR family transcriptional regulator